MLMDSVLATAEDCFSCGRVEECAKLLESELSETVPFSRAQWRNTANILACRMKCAMSDGSIDRLAEVHTHYRTLWEKIIGLPLTEEGLSTEMTVTFALCQLEVILLSRGYHVTPTANQNLSVHCQRLCRYCCMEWSDLSSSLPLLSRRIAESANLLLKMVYLVAVVMMMSAETVVEGSTLMTAIQEVTSKSEVKGQQKTEVIDVAIEVKGHLEGNSDSDDLRYIKGWRKYSDGQYRVALSSLSADHTQTTPISNLLRGHCYSHMNKPHMEQCCYLACLRSPVTSLPAMSSCSLLYRRLSNTQAEIDARRMTLTALRTETRGGPVNEVLLWWRGARLHGDPIQPSGNEWVESAYTTALRANNVDVTADVLSDVLETVRGDLPPSLPSPSLLYLLTAQSLLASRQTDKAWRVCDKLINHLSTLDVEECPSLFVLVLAQALFMGSLALTQLNQLNKSKCLAHRSYRMCRYLISTNLQENSEIELAVTTLMESTLNLLSVHALGEGEQDNALYLTTQAVSLSHTHHTHTSHNYCLLLSQLGKVKDSAHFWLKGRGILPTSRTEARKMIQEKKSTLTELGMDCERLDVAMLKVWIRYNQ